MGVTLQFLCDWKIKQAVGGFKEFKEKHTAENIRKKLDDFLFNELGLEENQVILIVKLKLYFPNMFGKTKN